jgi:hypothetical protein
MMLLPGCCHCRLWVMVFWTASKGTISSSAGRLRVDVTHRSARRQMLLQLRETTIMAKRLTGLVLVIALAISLAGCARDPFACCDQRKSLADWFDMYGPTGCSCPDGNCRCANGNCR